MTAWFLVALVIDAQLALLCAAFLAGSMHRSNVLWAACLAGIGLAALAMISVSSVESLPSVFHFNPVRVAQRVWINSDYSVVLIGLLIAVPIPLIGFGAITYALRRYQNWRGAGPAAFMASVLLALFVATLTTSSTAVVPQLDSSNVEVLLQDLSAVLKVPADFQVRAYLPKGIAQPTSMAFDSKDRLFVASQRGVVAVVDDSDRDGLGDNMWLFMSTDGPILGLTISSDDKTVYLANNGNVLLVEDHDLDGVADSSKRIIDGLPSFVYRTHSNNGLEIGPDGQLYMTLGGTSDHGPENHPLAGSILVANPDGSDLRVYARGLRNPYDLTFTTTGLRIASDNGPDSDMVGPDELVHVQEGGNYGYPEVFGFPPADSDTLGPIVLFTEHSVPTGKVAYPGGQFPAEFKDQIFVTLFSQQPRDSKVVAVTLHETEPGVIGGTTKDFALGFSNAIDVAVDSHGRLYVADYTGGQIYQISWLGGGPTN